MLNAAVILIALFNCINAEKSLANALVPLTTDLSDSSYMTNASMLMQKIVADPEVFVSELASADPSAIRSVIGILEGLLRTGTISSTKFKDDVTDADGVLQAAIVTHDDLGILVDDLVEEKRLAVLVVQNLTTTIETKTEEKDTAGDDRTTAQDRHALLKAERDANVPMLTTENTALSSAISLLQQLIHEDSSEIVNVPESSRSYSSVHNNDAIGTDHATSMLSSPQAWSAKTNQAGEWMIMDIGSVDTVLGVVEAGRGTGGVHGDASHQYVTSFTVATSIDGVTFTDETSAFSSASAQADYNFDNAVSARYVRITVVSWQGHVSLRADVRVKSA